MKNQMGGECGMHRREERCRKGFGREIAREEGKRPLRTPRYRWEINKNRFLVGQKDVDWIDLAHNMDKWLVLVNNSNEPSYSTAQRFCD